MKKSKEKWEERDSNPLSLSAADLGSVATRHRCRLPKLPSEVTESESKT